MTLCRIKDRQRARAAWVKWLIRQLLKNKNESIFVLLINHFRDFLEQKHQTFAESNCWLDKKMLFRYRNCDDEVSLKSPTFLRLNIEGFIFFCCLNSPQSGATQIAVRWSVPSHGAPPYWLDCRTVLVELCCPVPQLAEQGLHRDQLDHLQSTAGGTGQEESMNVFILPPLNCTSRAANTN